MPVTNDVTVATYADDTAILSSSQCPTEASHFVQTEINLIEKWFKKWNIKVNPPILLFH